MQLWTDPFKDGIRLVLAVLTFIIPLYIANDEISQLAHSDAIKNGLQWATITCVMISQPVLGKTSQISFERACGTLIGGSLGMAMLFTEQVGAILACCGVLCLVATYFGGTNKLDYGGKLCVITYVIVIACVCRGANAIVSQWASRVLGIISGIFLTLVLNIFVFPRSATNKAMQEIRKAITALSDMHEASWNIVMPLDPGADVSEQRKKDSAACEKAYSSAITALRGIEDSIPITEDERIIGSFLGRRILIPRWHLISSKESDSVLPGKKVQALATALRRSYRALWSQHLALDDGFGLDLTLAFISKYSASGLLDELRSSMRLFLDELLESFPSEYGAVNTCVRGQDPVSSAGLDRYTKALQDLLDLSDAYYQKLMERSLERKTNVAIQATSADDPVKDGASTASVSITIGESRDLFNQVASGISRSWNLPVTSTPISISEEGAAKVSIEEGAAKVSIKDKVEEMTHIQARLRWYGARFAMQCLLREASELHITANILLASVPGHYIKDS